MGKERRLEKKIKKLEEVASVGGAANEVATTVVAELSSSPSSVNEVVAGKVDEKEKKPRKKRTKKPVEPAAAAAAAAAAASPQSDSTSPSNNITSSSSNSESVIPQPAELASTAAVESTPAPTEEESPQMTASSESTPPVIGQTESSAKSMTSMASESPEAASEAAAAEAAAHEAAAAHAAAHEAAPEASSEAVEESASVPSQNLGNLNLPAATDAPKSTSQKIDMLSDAVYEFVTEQILALRVLRETVAAFASEECQKACDAKLRKRPRPQTGVTTPKKRRLTGFQMFCQVKRLELTPAKQAFAELGKMWKELTDDERAHYKLEAERVSVGNDGQHSDQILENGHEGAEELLS